MFVGRCYVQDIKGCHPQGKIEPLEEITLPEGSKVLVTLVADDEAEFWLQASQPSVVAIWDAPEDDVYAQLLKE